MSFVRLLRVVFSVGAAALIGSLAVPARAATTTYDTNNTPYAGGTIDPGDTVLLNDGATVTGNVTANGTLQFNQSDTTFTISNVISGTGTLLLTNAGTLNLTRLCALVYLSQDVGLVLGFKRSPHGLLQQRRIRSLLPVATACSWPTPSRRLRRPRWWAELKTGQTLLPFRPPLPLVYSTSSGSPSHVLRALCSHR